MGLRVHFLESCTGERHCRADHTTDTMLPVRYTSTRQTLAVMSHLLSVARKFLGGPERIDGDEIKSSRLSNEEEKAQTMHRRTMEESKGCFP